MAENTHKPAADLKPGSDPADAKALVGAGDFGVRESDVAERTYTSANTKAADHGAAQPNSFEHLGKRESGAGARDNGRGSGSGGDVDPDDLGLTTAGTIAADPPATGDGLVGKIGGPHPQINVVTPSDARTTGTGADQVSHSDEGDADNSFRGEISSAEASGRDDKGV